MFFSRATLALMVVLNSDQQLGVLHVGGDVLFKSNRRLRRRANLFEVHDGKIGQKISLAGPPLLL
jgi:hypothetical protein